MKILKMAELYEPLNFMRRYKGYNFKGNEILKTIIESLPPLLNPYSHKGSNLKVNRDLNQGPYLVLNHPYGKSFILTCPTMNGSFIMDERGQLRVTHIVSFAARVEINSLKRAVDGVRRRRNAYS